MQPNYNPQNPKEQAPKMQPPVTPPVEAPTKPPVAEAPPQEYVYQEYQPAQEYQPTEYWTPSYENVQKKYSGKEYAAKQYVPEKTLAGEGKATADYLVANQNNNEVKTYEGNDVIEAGYGSDKIDAGTGDDWIWGISKTHNSQDKKYAQKEYKEVDWMTGGEGKDIYALGTENHAHYATNGNQDYAVLTDYKGGEDAVMLHGTAKNYVVGESVTMPKGETTPEEQGMMEPTATIYWDKDQNGSYSKGDDMVAVFEGYSAEEITAAKDSWIYVAPQPPVV